MGQRNPMGSLFSSPDPLKVVVVGLDNSGKSSILKRMQATEDGQITEVTPTVGFTSEEFEHGDCTFKAWDMSGQSRYRNLWPFYYQESQGIIFVVDSTDQFRMKVVADELKILLNDEGTRRKPVLFFANKKDMVGAAEAHTIFQALQLGDVSDRAIQIQSVPPFLPLVEQAISPLVCSHHLYVCRASNALNGDGIEEGLNW